MDNSGHSLQISHVGQFGQLGQLGQFELLLESIYISIVFFFVVYINDVVTRYIINKIFNTLLPIKSPIIAF